MSDVILVGHPNVGKSALFQRLTGRRTTVSNYPGTTVDITLGSASWDAATRIVDTPGILAFPATSEDEEVVERALDEAPCAIVQVGDAKNLRRTLKLTSQLAERRVPLVLVLNMTDEARRRGIVVDDEEISRAIGVPVVTTVATRGVGIGSVAPAVLEARVPQSFDVDELVAGAVSAPAARAGSPLERVATLTTHPLWGWPVLAAVLYAMYLFVGVLGAGKLVGLVETDLFGAHLNPWLTGLVDRTVPSGLVRDFLVGQYGLWTMGMTYALALILPIVTTFFIAFSLLEDSGYLPRLSVVSNRLFAAVGLNGKAALPMVLGLGCVTMATLTTRILETKRERLLATLLLALAVPCSAQLGVVLGMLASVSLVATMIWGGVVFGVLLGVGALAARVLPGERTPLVVELPPLRVPQLSNVLVKTITRLEWYVREVVPLFLIGTAALFVLDRVRALPALIDAAKPLVTGWLGLPPEAAAAFLVGFLRRDFGATGLFALHAQGQLNPEQVVVAMVTITLFIPCVASLLIIVRERGARVAAGMAAIAFPLAFVVGGLLHHALLLTGWGA